MTRLLAALARRLPFFYGWVIVGCAFVVMAVGVSARTAFSLLLPPIVEEFGWTRATVSGAFSFGFFLFAAVSPLIGRAMDRWGPTFVVGLGVAMVAGGNLLAPYLSEPWHLYLTLGLLVGAGANLTGYTGQSLYVPLWFQKRRGLAISIAFSGVGVGAIVLLPWMQTIILAEGWRAACQAMALVMIVVVAPLTLLLRRRPEDLGLQPDGAVGDGAAGAARRAAAIVDQAWAATEWTLRRALRTARFWWLSLGLFGSLFIWYMVQVHQTKYLIECGFDPATAAWALGFVSIVGIPGQILLGGLSDRIGREWIWTAGAGGFCASYLCLIAMEHLPSPVLLWAMGFAQGFFGYAMTSVLAPIVSEIFEGPHYGAIFGSLTVSAIAGGAAGPWIAGAIHDATGSYAIAFWLAAGLSVVSAVAIWMAAPRKVRLVPGRMRKGA